MERNSDGESQVIQISAVQWLYLFRVCELHVQSPSNQFPNYFTSQVVSIVTVSFFPNANE